MPTSLKYPTSTNAVQKTLDAALLAGATASVTLNSVVGIQNKAGVFVVDRVDANGTATPSKREYVTFTGVSGSTLTGLTRNADGGGTDQDHAVGAIVEFVSDVLQEQAIIDGLLNVITTAGSLDTTKVVDLTTAQTLATKTLTSPVLTTPQINDTSADHQYVVAVSELTADRTVTFPLLTGNDEFVFKDHTQAITNKTIGTTNLVSFNSPRGFLINGKISVADAAGITVAIKGLDGNDPSATNPVYCRIGDTVRSITSALSVAKADGTNWFNSGGAELATKEVDYFVYLGYNATDGVVIGFSRIPFANEYDDFSSTTTNEKYCAISTITNAAAGDDYENIGRFAATLSAGAGYTWTVPTFTNKNLIQRPIFESRWLDYVPTFTVAELDNGSGGQPTITVAKYRISGRKMESHVKGNGTKAGTNPDISLTMPISYTDVVASSCVGNVFTISNTSTQGGGVVRVSSTTKIYCLLTANITDNVVVDAIGINYGYEI